MGSLPPIDVDDAKQNAFVQDWLTAYLKKHPGNGSDHPSFEEVIEAIQETYSP